MAVTCAFSLCVLCVCVLLGVRVDTHWVYGRNMSPRPTMLIVIYSQVCIYISLCDVSCRYGSGGSDKCYRNGMKAYPM